VDLRVTPQTVQRQVADKLRNAILTGHFKPGERLVEASLCRLMNVSRPSIREALRRLEAEKLIVIVANRGPAVAEITWETAEQIYKVRAILEGEAAALFAVRATVTEEKQMRNALDAFASAQEDPLGRLNATNAFYEVMLAGCGNQIIRELLEELNARINFLRAHSMSQPGRSRHSLAEMRRLLQAIEKNDPKNARICADEHVQAACAAARDAFGRQPGIKVGSKSSRPPQETSLRQLDK
jgi:DNA-binding GntR family transcriptional regulator